MRVFVVVGTRPEAIKMAPVFTALSEIDGVLPSMVVTGQHREMARGVLDLFGISPEFDLDVMEPNQSLTRLMAKLSDSLASLFSDEHPDVILVQGDTTSAAVAGMLGFYSDIPVGHVEAGLRTGNLGAPYPEEFNRRLIALAARWHFAPTDAAAQNLHREGIVNNVHIVGNTVVDAAQKMACKRTHRMQLLNERIGPLDNPARPTILVTAHRRESFGAPLQEIATAIAYLASEYPNALFVVPVHPNPKVGSTLRPILASTENVHLIQPLEYDELIFVLRHCHMVLTDSGGIQEEAPTFSVPVLVLRNETERMEGVGAGCSRLIGTDRDAVIEAARELLDNEATHASMASAENPYGDGKSSERIASIIGSA